jgi:hypothetical protein
MSDTYRFQFKPDILAREIEDALFWAVFNAESVFGKAKVRLDGSFALDKHRKNCVIEGSTEVGQHIAKIFTSLVAKKFGEEAFVVERISPEEELGHGR